jgi:hypothetical protein
MDGTPGATSLGNTELVDYGIQNEQSDIRVHVCPKARRVYVFPTECGVEAVRSGQYRLVEGRQKGVDVPTSMGYLVPPLEIEGCAAICLRDVTWADLDFTDTDTLEQKGRKATRLVKGMLRKRRLPIPMEGEVRATDITEERQGQDIILTVKRSGALKSLRIQVKCDYPGGEGEGCTGNLFLQVQECNPLGIH